MIDHLRLTMTRHRSRKLTASSSCANDWSAGNSSVESGVSRWSWSSVDADKDNRIDEAELAQLLRALDPSLARWSPQLLQALDRDKDGKLQPIEIAAMPPQPGTAAAGRGQLPKQSPLR